MDPAEYHRARDEWQRERKVLLGKRGIPTPTRDFPGPPLKWDDGVVIKHLGIEQYTGDVFMTNT